MPDIFVAKYRKTPKDQKPSRNNLSLTQYTPSSQKTDKNLRIFSAFCMNPTGISFENKEEDEKILLLLRRHIITNFFWVLTTVILLIIPLIFVVLSSYSINPFIFMSLPARFIFFFAAFYYLIVLTFALINFINWYFNIALVTDKRVIDVNFSELVYKNVSTTRFDLLQDASYNQTGVLRSLFNYGDVLLQTAGSLENFDIRAVPYPDRVVHLVEGLLGRRKNI